MKQAEQMGRLLKEGGMADDGMDIEPTTGNEIPPGSLSSEVRDDIDAKLSGGEYVVPADVLRYYGVRFFEDLRSQAKQGMAEMDAAGRIGGAAVDKRGIPLEGEEEALSPEEEQMLMEALGAKTGMAEGGSVGSFDRTQFDSTAYAKPALGTSGITEKKYINPETKEVRVFNFIGETPLGLIPKEFVPWTQELQDANKEKEDKIEPTVTLERGRGDGTTKQGEGEAGSNWAEENYDAITSDPYGFGMKALQDASKSSLGFLGKTGIGGLLNDASKAKAIGEANAALSRVTDPEQKKSLEEGIGALENSLQSPLAGVLSTLGLLATGNQYNKMLEEEAKKRASAPKDTAATSGKTSPTGSTGGTAAGATTGAGGAGSSSLGGGGVDSRTPSGNALGFGKETEGKSVGAGNKGNGLGFSDSTTGGVSATSSGGGYSMGVANTGQTSGNTSGGYSMGVEQEDRATSRGGSVGPLAKGGLITRPTKKKTKKVT